MAGTADPAHCPVCTSTDTHCFHSQREVPTQCGFLAPTREQALSAPVGEIALQHCRSCSHIWNRAFDPDLVGFHADYDLSQFYSPAYRQYSEESISRLDFRYGLSGKTAVEIACGKGDFLRMLLAAGMEWAVGFDPTFVDPGFTPDENQQLVIHRRFYARHEANLRPDLVVCRGCLQYIPRPHEFVAALRETLGEHTDTVVFFQTSNSALAFRDKIIWYVMYEAGCFFSAPSLARLFRSCGFQVLDIVPVLDEAHFEIECRPGVSPTAHALESPTTIAEIAHWVDEFPAIHAQKLRHWSSRFGKYRQERKKVALWGAGMRAISLLCGSPEAADCIEVAADVNVKRQGRFLPKTGQRVVSPQELASMKPDLVVCTNPTYANEIARQMAELGLRCEYEILN